MAKNKSTVYLGYEEEEITAKHAALLNSNVNKFGGIADWPSGDIKVPGCPLCGTARPLIVQLYAPLEQSQFHRTLYVFGCLNPVCSQHSKSWLCVRTQHLDTPMAELISAAVQPNANKKKNKKQPQKQQKINWCSGADDWGEAAAAASSFEDAEKMDTAADDDDDFQLQQQNEQNGNVMIASKNDNSPTTMSTRLKVGVGAASLEMSAAEIEFVDDVNVEEEDDDDDSNSMENDLIGGFGQLEMNSPQQEEEEDPNANGGVGVAAAAAAAPLDAGCFGGGTATATICAELEGAETDVVLVETPQKPERDLIALLKHTTTPVALGPLAKLSDVQLKAFFIAVEVEQRQSGGMGEYENYGGALSADHIRELYQEYKRQDEAAHSPNGGGAVGGDIGAAGVAAAGGDEQESYEKSLPAHGDLIFHQFVSTVQQNPGQILRYSRDTLPLLIAPLAEPVPKCQNCNGETLCEVQILSTLIPKLRLQQNSEPAPIEYGNVLVFTCLKSCWDTPDKMRYERIIVQAEK